MDSLEHDLTQNRQGFQSQGRRRPHTPEARRAALGKGLSNIRTIMVVTKINDQGLVPKTRELTHWLLDPTMDVDYVVYVQDKLRTNKRFDVSGLLDDLAGQHVLRSDYDDGGVHATRASLQNRLRYWNEEMCRMRPHMFDLVITLGGDGTVLYSSWLFQGAVPPVLSFTLGSLGFLTKLDFAEYKSLLASTFSERVIISRRARLHCTIMRRTDGNAWHGIWQQDEKDLRSSGDPAGESISGVFDVATPNQSDGTYEILNDVVVGRGPNPTMSYIQVSSDYEHFTVLADGICISTPTGSTAYNLAAGGPLCHPDNPVILVTSICAHTLSFRPIVLPATVLLRVGVPYGAPTTSWASFDGRERVELQRGDYVDVRASCYPFMIVQTEKGKGWINSISKKLGWNRPQQHYAFGEVEK